MYSESIADRLVEAKDVSIKVGHCTNGWDPNNNTIPKSSNYGDFFTTIPLPFNVSFSTSTRTISSNSVLVWGTVSGARPHLVKGDLLKAFGIYSENPADTSGYNNDPLACSRSRSIPPARRLPPVPAASSSLLPRSANRTSSWAAVPDQQTMFYS
jgi:xyloglucan-specific exo-beta-1,4-glucanase